MPLQTILETAADRQWLRDTHLKPLPHIPFVVAILHGNEDCPDRIELYRVNRHDAVAENWARQDDGSYVRNER